MNRRSDLGKDNVSSFSSSSFMSTLSFHDLSVYTQLKRFVERALTRKLAIYYNNTDQTKWKRSVFTTLQKKIFIDNDKVVVNEQVRENQENRCNYNQKVATFS